ncbi:ubiquinone anaerobic biosynthesis accessory factor UbiT [Inmirania thermothiophila]|uniref:Ubiquinone biosynthesis accessory factor UbiT n=1 Tax=Inmirania thermothiophila TaxID=1750597 RepID=A0A3N1XSG6_9GAMM|nr:SCP2 sterol-binding domain-containing protein [Inmirania thermothiophila]ROR29584.1 putative lipid carrier protein YhbT [Inmirania thermothiophila]
MGTTARLPRLLAWPLGLVPGVVHSAALAVAVNRALAPALARGEFAFLEGRTVALRIRDAAVTYRLRLEGGRFVAAARPAAPDVTISGDLHDFLLLATRREDHDSLFFQRRLRMEGDTALGLELKNLLDSMESVLPALPRPLEAALQRAVDVYERLFAGGGAVALDDGRR